MFATETIIHISGLLGPQLAAGLRGHGSLVPPARVFGLRFPLQVPQPSRLQEVSV